MLNRIYLWFSMALHNANKNNYIIKYASTVRIEVSQVFQEKANLNKQVLTSLQKSHDTLYKFSQKGKLYMGR